MELRNAMSKFLSIILTFYGVSNAKSKKSLSPCLNPRTYDKIWFHEVCSGSGACKTSKKGREMCECDLVNALGGHGISHELKRKQLQGKWCHCNPWNCASFGPGYSYLRSDWCRKRYRNCETQPKYSSDEICSGHGQCQCDESDPDSVAKCVCDEKYSGNFCEFVHEDNENFDGDFDGDQKMDSLDLDDDNDGIPDVFEFKYEGSYKGPWKPGEDKRFALCPRIKFNLECGENFNFSKRPIKISYESY